jgi:hypothetical protein
MDVSREFRKIDYTIVKVVFQVLSTFASSMAIIDPEDLNVGPVRHYWNLVHRMYHIKNDCYSIFIVLTDQSNIRIGRKRFYSSECFMGYFTVLKVW